MGRAKRFWYLLPMRAAKVQASLRIRAVSPEPSLLAHTSSESRGTFRQKARSLAPLNGWACAVEICHDGMLEDTNSLDGAHFFCFLVPEASYEEELTLPTFTQKPKFQKIDEGTTVSFTAQVVATPKPDVSRNYRYPCLQIKSNFYTKRSGPRGQVVKDVNI